MSGKRGRSEVGLRSLPQGGQQFDFVSQPGQALNSKRAGGLVISHADVQGSAHGLATWTQHLLNHKLKPARALLHPKRGRRELPSALASVGDAQSGKGYSLEVIRLLLPSIGSAVVPLLPQRSVGPGGPWAGRGLGLEVRHKTGAEQKGMELHEAQAEMVEGDRKEKEMMERKCPCNPEPCPSVLSC